MKTIAVIGASYLQRPLVEKAKQMGLRVLCFAWEEGAVCRDIADVYYPISIVEKDEILRVCKAEHISGVCTIASDVAAPTVAYVAESMGLCGNSYEAALRANNKFLMREAFMRHDVPSPHHQMVQSVAQLQADYVFPLIVKPADRSGSLGVEKVNNSEELLRATENAIRLSFSQQAMVEQFVEGREISVECISFQSQHYPLTITDKVTTGAPHFVELEHHQPAALSPAMYEQIYAITKNALDALDITCGASHSEFKITPDGEVYIMEVGARMGGDFIGSDLVQLSTGYDFLRGVVEAALGDFHVPTFAKQQYAGVYFLCKETECLTPFFNNPAALTGIISCERTNNDLRSVTCSADRSGYLIYQASKRILLS